MNLRAVVVVVLGVATTIVLLAVVPQRTSSGGAHVVSSASALPTSSTISSGGTTQTTAAATTTTRKAGSKSNTTVPTTTTFPTAGRPELKLGSTGPDVVALQQRLNALGYNAGTANGNFGTSTQTAVMNFQKAKNLAADGVVGPTTWAALAAG